MVLLVANLVLNFQSYERVHFWSFHVLSLWHFVMAAYSVCNRDKLGVPSKFTVPPALKWKDALSKRDCLTVSARILCLGPDKPNSVIGRDQHSQTTQWHSDLEQSWKVGYFPQTWECLQ